MRWQNVPLGRRIEAGFGCLLGLTLILGCILAWEVGPGTLRWTVVGTTVAVVVLGMVLAFVIARSVGRILEKVADGIEENALAVAGAAGRMAGISAGLSASAGEQAAMVEETAASLEEMSAMSRQTSELTAGSEKLMSANIERSGQSLKALVELTRNMEEIESDADAIRSIINTIDSIAFQTNLLALNAAVEAARAGEAGAGFAVVADEVKGLANRTAEAARHTQELLDKNITRIVESAEALKRVNADFDEIVSTATGIGEKTSAITAATQELSAGIEQLTQASVNMERATRKVSDNAGAAHDAAGALAGEAEEMGLMVTHLVSMVHGTKRKPVQISVPRANVTCWEMKNCPPERRDSCPAYPDRGNQCWAVTGTLCGGQEQGSYREKMANCRKCDVYQAAHGEGSAQIPAAAPGGAALPAGSGQSAVVCWEMKNCPPERRDSCPAYPNDGGSCWMVTGTLCGGQEQGSYREKMANCRKCDVYQAAHGDGPAKTPAAKTPAAAGARILPLARPAAAPAPKAVVCWEMKNCPTERRDSCPAYPNDGDNCWMVTGTLCGGKEQGSYREKMANCRKCDVYQAAHA